MKVKKNNFKNPYPLLLLQSIALFLENFDPILQNCHGVGGLPIGLSLGEGLDGGVVVHGFQGARGVILVEEEGRDAESERRDRALEETH